MILIIEAEAASEKLIIQFNSELPEMSWAKEHNNKDSRGFEWHKISPVIFQQKLMKRLLCDHYS